MEYFSGLVAGTFRVKKMPKFKFAYSVLTRNQSDLQNFIRVESDGEVIENIPGDELFSGTVRINSNFKEEWMGFSIAYPIGEHFSVGLTNFPRREES